MAQKLRARVIVRNRTTVVAAPPLVPGDYYTFATRADIALATVTPYSALTPAYWRTAGYATVGDGGHALYKVVASEPAHAGKQQSLNGVWGEIVPELGQASVRQFGAKGDGVTNDTAACQNAINYMQNPSWGGNGVLHFPPGNYSVIGGLTTAGSMTLKGAGRAATILQAWHTDVVVLNCTGLFFTNVEDMTIFGKGINGDTGAFGAVSSAMIWNSLGAHLHNLRIWGGYYALIVTGSDFKIVNVNASNSYGPAGVAVTGAGFWYGGGFDLGTVGYAVSNKAASYPAWAGTTAYTQGHVVSLGGYLIQCTVAGISGGSSPTLKNIGGAMVDGTVTWNFACAEDYSAMHILAGASETHIIESDFSGELFKQSAVVDNPGSYTYFSGCDLSSPVILTNGAYCSIRNNFLGADISVLSGIAEFSIQDNAAIGPINIIVSPNVSTFTIDDNHLKGGTITVLAGTSNDYSIWNNKTATVVDGGTGTNKRVNGIGGSIAPSAFSATKGGTNQTGIADSVFTQITWPTEVYDVGGRFASNGWTPPSGKISLSASIFITGTFSAAAIVLLAIYKDGVMFRQKTIYAPTANACPADICIEDVASGSNVYTVQVYVDVSAATATISGAASDSFFNGHMIS